MGAKNGPRLWTADLRVLVAVDEGFDLLLGHLLPEAGQQVAQLGGRDAAVAVLWAEEEEGEELALGSRDVGFFYSTVKASQTLLSCYQTLLKQFPVGFIYMEPLMSKRYFCTSI